MANAVWDEITKQDLFRIGKDQQAADVLFLESYANTLEDHCLIIVEIELPIEPVFNRDVP